MSLPEGFSLEEFTGTSFGVFQGPLTKVKIWFSTEVAGYVKEKVWHENQEIHEQKDGSVIFEADVAGTDEIRFWVMGWGSHAEVMEPESLIERIRQEAEQLSETYSKGIAERERPADPRISPCWAELQISTGYPIDELTDVGYQCTP